MTTASESLIVRPAGVADVDRVAPLFDAYRQFYDAAPDLAAARTFLADRLTRGESVILLACLEPSRRADAEEVIGFAQLYPSFSSLALGSTIVLNDLFVAMAWRRHGVARRLLESVEAHARTVGAAQIELATQHTNLRALRLYEQRGYARDTEFVHLSRAVPRRVDTPCS